MSEMQLPTVGPLWALPEAKLGVLVHMVATVRAKSAFFILILPIFYENIDGARFCSAREATVSRVRPQCLRRLRELEILEMEQVTWRLTRTSHRQPLCSSKVDRPAFAKP